MRVISQDGKTDIPYENFVFSILNSGSGNCGIVAVKNVAEPPEVFMNSLIAVYTTEEKALKAMEMLRQEYLRVVEINQTNPVTDEIVEITGRQYYFNVPKVFQFPQDDEIEV